MTRDAQTNSWDSGVAGLIQAAIALPVHVVLCRLFQLSNEQSEQQRWLTWSIPRTLLFGPIRWLWVDPAVRRLVCSAQRAVL